MLVVLFMGMSRVYVPACFITVVSSLVVLDELCGLAYSDSILGLGLCVGLINVMGVTFTIGLLFKYYFWLCSSVIGISVILLLLYSGISSICY